VPSPSPEPAPRPSGHYFDPAPAGPSAPRPVTLTLPDLTVELEADGGVFSADRIDPGTRYLLGEGPRPTPGARHLLDLGCGYGPIAIALARRAPEAIVWAVDVNERAVARCAANAERAGCPGVRTLLVPADDPVAGIPTEVAFDGIWSNPPIRIGKPALHQLLLAALERLAPDGTAHLVVQKHLGADSLQRWLVERGWSTQRAGSRAGYRLLDVTRTTT
jgi:16S rRNA (guanine1207-N2)-methyltransferase